MTTEEIIQRLLEEKHITVSEAIQMIRDLVRNEIFIPTRPYPKDNIVTVYGVNTPIWEPWESSYSQTATESTSTEDADNK